jgi:hypothetical protein
MPMGMLYVSYIIIIIIINGKQDIIILGGAGHVIIFVHVQKLIDHVLWSWVGLIHRL